MTNHEPTAVGWGTNMVRSHQGSREGTATGETALSPSLLFEQECWSRGQRHIAGVDEVGRGPWAGPVVAAAVVLPADPAIAEELRGVHDSKRLTPGERERLDAVIRRHATAVAVGVASPAHIDREGLLPATARAMERALAGLALAPDDILIDGLPLRHLAHPHRAIVRGDAACLSIAAASIVAKVARDGLMAGLDAIYPGYGFGRHKGYGTRVHYEALCRLGPCPVHRRSYAPVAGVIAQSWDE